MNLLCLSLAISHSIGDHPILDTNEVSPLTRFALEDNAKLKPSVTLATAEDILVGNLRDEFFDLYVGISKVSNNGDACYDRYELPVIAILDSFWYGGKGEVIYFRSN